MMQSALVYAVYVVYRDLFERHFANVRLSQNHLQYINTLCATETCTVSLLLSLHLQK